LALTYCDEDKRDFMGCTNLLLDESQDLFIPVLVAAIELLEMIILHTIETCKKLKFWKLL